LTELGKLGREQFLVSYPHPMLLHRFDAQSELKAAQVESLLRGAGRFRTELTEADHEGSVLVGNRTDLELVVHPLRKRPGNAYPDTVTLGRADTNDIVVPYDDLSKLHAYFTRSTEGALQVADAGSTNGSWLAGERLRPNESRRLAARDQLGFGEHAFELFLPQPFAKWLSSLAGALG
jgi:hypothetical protein